MASPEKLQRRAEKARATTMRRHVLVCTDGDCGGKTVAKTLRKEVARQGLRDTVSVAKVDCLDICKGGTIAVVYPDGVWYHGLDEDSARDVVRDHLDDGAPLDDHVFLRNDLRCPAADATP